MWFADTGDELVLEAPKGEALDLIVHCPGYETLVFAVGGDDAEGRSVTRTLQPGENDLLMVIDRLGDPVEAEVSWKGMRVGMSNEAGLLLIADPIASTEKADFALAGAGRVLSVEDARCWVKLTVDFE